MDIAALLRPYVENLSYTQLDQISTYIEILLRWNSKMNLTAVRDPEQIVIRHFGESLFLARTLSDMGVLRSAGQEGGRSTSVIDVGSGAGFPGIPLKIACPDITLSLIEAQQRKAVFLKEVLRAINLDAEVKNIRAEEVVRTSAGSADLVTMRAVEKFETILPVAAQLARPEGRIALLIGNAQAPTVQRLLPKWKFDPLLPVPESENRVILVANQGG